MTHKVYFLRRRDGLVKIGTTRNLAVRLTALTNQHGHLEVLRIVNGDAKRERSLHSKFKRHRQFGEWFAGTPDLVDAIRQLPEGDEVSDAPDSARTAWERGEKHFMQGVRRRAKDIVRIRAQRSGVKRAIALQQVNEEYGFSKWFLTHITNGRAMTVSGYAAERLRLAHIAEMTAFRDALLMEMKELDEAEAARLAAEIAARKAALK